MTFDIYKTPQEAQAHLVTLDYYCCYCFVFFVFFFDLYHNLGCTLILMNPLSTSIVIFLLEKQKGA